MELNQPPSFAISSFLFYFFWFILIAVTGAGLIALVALLRTVLIAVRTQGTAGANQHTHSAALSGDDDQFSSSQRPP